MVSSSLNLDAASLRQWLRDALTSEGFRRATFAGPKRSQSPWLRVTVRKLELHGKAALQFSYFDGRKDIAKNFSLDECELALDAVLAAGFANIHVATAGEAIDVRISKKGKIFASQQAQEYAGPAAPPAHNRAKAVPLPEDRAARLLHAMGLLGPDGRVKPTLRAKYTQINEFLNQLLHVLDEPSFRGLGRPVEILDCGCGASYLTLAAHYYLNEVRGLPARILGVDVNDEVIAKSMQRWQQLDAAGVEFACRQIEATEARPDIVLALHACDTATDAAIALAIRSEAKLFLGVPCCHHELHPGVRSAGAAEVLRPVLRHGILRQRTADLVTDAFRALVLRICGYRTEVVEFISSEHTARNLMIRAVRGVPARDPAFLQEYAALKAFWGVTPYLDKLVAEL